MTLTPEQQTALTRILDWFTRSKGTMAEFKLGGYAGTGKTTLIKHLLDSTELDIIVTAFTGKACSVLIKKGVRAQTLHSLIYNSGVDPITHELWFTRTCLPPRCDLIIVDESSMLSTSLYDDLVSFGIPCLFVGDPGQLEPIGDNPNLMQQPDYVLQTIHRQAAGNPIIALAQEVRMGHAIPYTTTDERVHVTSDKLDIHNLTKADQVICATNKTRKLINGVYRKFYNFAGHGLVVGGEKLICLRNNPKHGVFNGVTFTVKSIQEVSWGWMWSCLVEDDAGKRMVLPVWQQPFLHPTEEVKMVPKDVVYCDYGYAITCHKAQGSEWDYVHVVDEKVPPIWDMKRWRYTAITRAAKKLVYTQ